MNRKILFRFLSILVLLSLLCSCAPDDNKAGSEQTNKKVVAYLSDVSDGLISASTSIDKKLPDWLDLKYYDDVDKEATVVYNGVTYTGTYQRTYTLYLDTQPVDRYIAHHLSFCLTRDTKELYGISGAALRENEPEEKKRNFSVDECIKLANEIAKQYINVAEYNIETFTYDDSGTESIIYRKYYNGIRTSESLKIGISYITGKPLEFEMCSIGQFTENAISEENKETLDFLLKESKTAADKKSEEFCKKICDTNGYTLKSITEGTVPILYRFANGDFALITKYSVDFEEHGEAFEIVTMVEA